MQIRGLEEDNRSLQTALEIARKELRQLHDSRARVAERNEALAAQHLNQRQQEQPVCVNASVLSAEETRALVLAVSEDCNLDHKHFEGGTTAVSEEELRQIYHRVVGLAHKDNEDPFFLLKLAAIKVNEGNVRQGLAFMKQHFSLFLNTTEGRALFLRRLASLDRDLRSSESVYLATHPEVEGLRLSMMLELAVELENGYLIAENRRLASILLETYLADAPFDSTLSPRVWFRLGRLRAADGRAAEAARCYQIAEGLSPAVVEYAEAAASATRSMYSVSWSKPRPVRVFIAFCGQELGIEGSAMMELHRLLRESGVDSLFVWPSGGKRRDKKAKGVDAAAVQPEALASGDLVIVSGRYPLPPRWRNAALLQQAPVVTWVFSERDLMPVQTVLPFQSQVAHWSKELITFAQEGVDVVKSPSRLLGVDDSYVRIATSHSLLSRISAPSSGLLTPHFPKHVYDEALHPRDTLSSNEEGGSIWKKQDLLVLRGEKRAVVDFIHTTLADLHRVGFCTPILATVTEVIPNSPASEGGLRVGDSILAIGVVSGGDPTAADSVAQEINHARGETLRLVLSRDESPVLAHSLSVRLRKWDGDGILGCKFAFAGHGRCLDRAAHGARPLTIKYVPQETNVADLAVQLQSAKVFLSLLPCTHEAMAPELLAALYDVSVLVPSSCPGTVDWRLSSRFILDDRLILERGADLVAEHVTSYHQMAVERRVLKDFVTDLPEQLRTSALNLFQGSQQLFYSVAADLESEAAACTFILSGKLSHPLAVIEVFVRDITSFHHRHSTFIHILRERGLWNDVHISQIPSSIQKQGRPDEAQETWHLYTSLAVRPSALHGVRSFTHACLLRPDHLLIPSSEFVSKLSKYSWPSSPYFAWSSKSSMQLPLCFSPAGMQAKLSKVTISPPAGAESGSKYLFRTMMSVAGLPMHKKLGDIGALFAGVSHLVPWDSYTNAAASGGARLALEAMVAHPAWAAVEPFLSMRRRTAVRSAAGFNHPTIRENSEQDCKTVCEEGRTVSGEEEQGFVAADSKRAEGLSSNAEELRQQILTLQRELLESTRMQEGWKAVAQKSQEESRELKEHVELLQAQILAPDKNSKLKSPHPGREGREGGDVEVFDNTLAVGTVVEGILESPSLVGMVRTEADRPDLARQFSSPVEDKSHMSSLSKSLLEEQKQDVSSTKIVVLSGRTSNQLMEDSKLSSQHVRSEATHTATTSNVEQSQSDLPLQGDSVSPNNKSSASPEDGASDREGVQRELSSHANEKLPVAPEVSHAQRQVGSAAEALVHNVSFASQSNISAHEDSVTSCISSSDVAPQQESHTGPENKSAPSQTSDLRWDNNQSQSQESHHPPSQSEDTEQVPSSPLDTSWHQEAPDGMASADTDDTVPLCPEGFVCGDEIHAGVSASARHEISIAQSEGQPETALEPMDVMTETVQKAEEVMKSVLAASARAQGYQEAREMMKAREKQQVVEKSSESLRSGISRGSQAIYRRAFAGASDRASSLRAEHVEQTGHPDSVSSLNAVAEGLQAKGSLATVSSDGAEIPEFEPQGFSSGETETPKMGSEPGVGVEKAGLRREAVQAEHEASAQDVRDDRAGVKAAGAAGAATVEREAEPQEPEAERSEEANKTSEPECGIGVGLGVREGGEWRINRIIAGGAAEQVGGLMAGDGLLEVQGVSTKGRPPAEIGRLVKGPRGSEVTLRISRSVGSQVEELEVRVPRACH